MSYKAMGLEAIERVNETDSLKLPAATRLSSTLSCIRPELMLQADRRELVEVKLQGMSSLCGSNPAKFERHAMHNLTNVKDTGQIVMLYIIPKCPRRKTSQIRPSDRAQMRRRPLGQLRM